MFLTIGAAVLALVGWMLAIATVARYRDDLDEEGRRRE